MKNFQLVFSFLLFNLIDYCVLAFVVTPTPLARQPCLSLEPFAQLWNEKPNKNEEIDNLQEEINKLVEDPPMFSAWDAENFDEKALPVPLFTAQVVSLASIGVTAWIYYLAFNPPSNSPTP